MAKNPLVKQGFRLPLNLKVKIDRIARTTGTTKSTIIRNAINEYVDKKES